MPAVTQVVHLGDQRAEEKLKAQFLGQDSLPLILSMTVGRTTHSKCALTKTASLFLDIHTSSHIVAITFFFFFETGLLRCQGWSPTYDPSASNSSIPGLQMCMTMCLSHVQFVTCIYRYKLTGSESHYVEGKGHVPSQCLQSKRKD